jgi:hypothetical protein
MTATPTDNVCSACGAAVPGRFCGNCGQATGPRSCGACQAELSAQARFCHRCGTPAPGAAAAPPRAGASTDRSERNAWIVAGGIVAILLAVIVYKMFAGGPGGPAVPDMANAGNSAPGQQIDAGGSLPTGPAPDISNLTPGERFLRLNNRVMEAAARGDTSTVVNFSPMAIAAYGQLDSVDNDLRYHAAVLNAQVGRVAEALALTDTMLTEVPGYLLAYVVRGDIAEFQKDAARLAKARTDFLAAWDREIAVRRVEYADHRNVLDQFRAAAARP